jgi:protein-disulfide isomerase
MFLCRRPLATLAAAALAAFVGTSVTRAQTPAFDAQQRQAIEQIVRDYMLKHPEVIQEAIAELERRQQDEQKTAQRQVLQTEGDAILNAAHSYVGGNPSGDVTLVEFFDYNCGYCKRALADVREMTRTDPKLRLVLKDFPVLGPESVEASRVALAARKQLQGERMFEFHTRLMETRGRVNGERALAVAKDMGLDVARLKKDMESADIKTALQQNLDIADKLGLSGTPAFIAGEEIIPGAVGIEPLRRLVASLRECGKAAC